MSNFRCRLILASGWCEMIQVDAVDALQAWCIAVFAVRGEAVVLVAFYDLECPVLLKKCACMCISIVYLNCWSYYFCFERVFIHFTWDTYRDGLLLYVRYVEVVEDLLLRPLHLRIHFRYSLVRRGHLFLPHKQFVLKYDQYKKWGWKGKIINLRLNWGTALSLRRIIL